MFNNICIICLEDNIDCKLIPCHHIYHWKCIFEWFKNKNECPICRLPSDNWYDLEWKSRYENGKLYIRKEWIDNS
jgi:hypothetical protein